MGPRSRRDTSNCAEVRREASEAPTEGAPWLSLLVIRLGIRCHGPLLLVERVLRASLVRAQGFTRPKALLRLAEGWGSEDPAIKQQPQDHRQSDPKGQNEPVPKVP